MRGERLGIIFVVLLALVWAVVLLPSLFRGKLQSSPSSGIRSFERDMGILRSTGKRSGGAPGRWIMIPRPDDAGPARRRNRVIRRRRRNFQRLLALAALTFIAGFLPSLRWVWFVHLAVDASIGFYVIRLLKYKREEAERAPEEIPAAAVAQKPAFATLPDIPMTETAPATPKDEGPAEVVGEEPPVTAADLETSSDPEPESDSEITAELAHRKSG